MDGSNASLKGHRPVRPCLPLYSSCHTRTQNLSHPEDFTLWQYSYGFVPDTKYVRALTLDFPASKMSENKFLLTLNNTLHFDTAAGLKTRMTLPNARHNMTGQTTGVPEMWEGVVKELLVLTLRFCFPAPPRFPEAPVLFYYLDKYLFNILPHLAMHSLKTEFQRLSSWFYLTNILVCKVQLSYFSEL